MQQAELNQQNLLAYQQRWAAVAAVEATEHQSSSITERWRQLNALFRVALSLNILPQNQDISLDKGQLRWQALYVHEQAQSE